MFSKRPEPEFVHLYCVVVEENSDFLLLKPVKNIIYKTLYNETPYLIKISQKQLKKLQINIKKSQNILLSATISLLSTTKKTFETVQIYDLTPIEETQRSEFDIDLDLDDDKKEEPKENAEYKIKEKESDEKQSNEPKSDDAVMKELNNIFAMRDAYAKRTQNKVNISTKTKYIHFLSINTPKSISEELNERIIGQELLTNNVADFVYYHILRQVHPELPTRPMLISGPSGSGKTEVWRVVKKLYGQLIPIDIIDGASITGEGWKGSNKLSTHITEQISDGGILVVDEFDKLASPRTDSGGSNIAMQLQSEFLKLLEGELVKEQRDSAYSFSDTKSICTKQMGIVLVGAFESIRNKQKNCVGFNKPENTNNRKEINISDEEFIDYGVMPELIGRISIKITTNQLSDEEYLAIIKNQYSRVSLIANVFSIYNINLNNIMTDEEILELVQSSKSNKTGVRWVSAKIENRMLEVLRENGVGDLRKKLNDKVNQNEDEFFM